MIEIPLKLTQEDLNVISAGVAELPWRIANPVIEKIQANVAAFNAEQNRLALEEARAPQEG